MSTHFDSLVLYNDISTIQREGHLLRVKSPVIKQWPWDIGMPLEHGSMAPHLQEHLGPVPQPSEFKSLVVVSAVLSHTYYVLFTQNLQRFAEALDQYDMNGAFKHIHRDFAWEYLSGSQRHVDARQSLLDLQHWAMCTSDHKMDFAVQSLLRYKLIDILANILGVMPHPERQMSPQVPMHSLPKKVEKLRNPLLCFFLKQKFSP